MAIFITGDTHGDFTRFKRDVFYEQAELTKDDCAIICGDFGGIWDGSANEQYWLDWLEKSPSLPCLSLAIMKTSACWRSTLWRIGAAGRFSVSAPL